MDTVTLNASVRNEHGKGPSRRLRAAGKLPVVAYGRGGDTLSLIVEHDALRNVLLSKKGRNSIIDLAVDGGDNLNVMVKTYTVHPLSRNLVHCDFIRVDEAQAVQVEIPFRTVGKAKGEIAGGTVLSNVRTLRMRCMPSNIPELVVHDVSELEINDSVKVSDLSLPEGAEVLMKSDRTLVTVAPPRVEIEETPEEGEGEEGAEGEATAEGDDAKPAEGGDDKKD
jgi:large subunit ribosomal protein L25